MMLMLATFWQPPKLAVAVSQPDSCWLYGADLADDPYRSLAALVRKAGGYQKSTKPFSEVCGGLAQRVAPKRITAGLQAVHSL